MTEWLKTPAGGYVLAWEQRQLDSAVVDLFGFHALQLGLPELAALRSNRMPHRWLATEGPVDGAGSDAAPNSTVAEAGVEACKSTPKAKAATSRVAVALHCDFDALPFEAASLDLVVLPHALELARDPHLALSEVERVLRPEGRVVIVGFNPSSLWGMRQWLGKLWRRAGLRSRRALYLPDAGEFIGYRRLRDWLRLLSFEVESGLFGCWRPPTGSQKWLDRFAWADRSGERWWPVFGAVYFVVAVKRVRGMRLVGLVRAQHRPAHAQAPVVAAPRQSKEMATLEELDP